MKLLSTIFIFTSLTLSSTEWKTDFRQAKAEATQNHKVILLNFSGSDWCTPCMRLKTEIFDAEEFHSYASQNLELVNADFPRLKKNKLSVEQSQQNDSLAAIYNPNGKFPLTVLIRDNGKVLKVWEGFPGVSPQEFVNQIKSVVDASR